MGLRPGLGLLKAEGGLMLAVVVIGVEMEDPFLGPREGTSSRKESTQSESVRSSLSPPAFAFMRREGEGGRKYILTEPRATAADRYHRSRHPRSLHLRIP